MNKNNKILEVRNLTISFHTFVGEVQAVRDVGFHVNEGEVLAIVGESGSGKSVSTQAILGLTPKPAGEIKSGEIIFEGKDLLKLNDIEFSKIRGNKITTIFQDPMTSLNPTMRIGNQIREIIHQHNNITKSESYEKTIELLKLTGITDPHIRIRQYPHQFSGGMLQRAMIAMAMANNPKILIADEPTTALDVTIQAQIFNLFRKLSKEFNTSIILITHDLGVVASIAHRVVVMYGGKVVEQGETDQIYYNPRHPYTKGLLSAMPSLAVEGQDRLNIIEGTPPFLLNVPKGCSFAERCEYAMEICVQREPNTYVFDESKVSCWLYHDQAKEQLKNFQSKETEMYGKSNSYS
jgi:oligopeptide transport system ATP-binding protein